MPKFDKVYCSQCGQEFGPRDSGYSHCSDHRTPSPLGLRIARELLSGYVLHGLCDEGMIRNAALIVDHCIEEERLERELDALIIAEAAEWERIDDEEAPDAAD